MFSPRRYALWRGAKDHCRSDANTVVPSPAVVCFDTRCDPLDRGVEKHRIREVHPSTAVSTPQEHVSVMRPQRPDGAVPTMICLFCCFMWSYPHSVWCPVPQLHVSADVCPCAARMQLLRALQRSSPHGHATSRPPNPCTRGMDQTCISDMPRTDWHETWDPALDFDRHSRRHRFNCTATEVIYTRHATRRHRRQHWVSSS